MRIRKILSYCMPALLILRIAAPGYAQDDSIIQTVPFA